MPVIGTPHRRRALVAAASKVDFNRTVPFKPEPDSDRLWGYYHALGEVWYVANFKAQAARRLTYYVGRQTEQGQDPEEVTEGPALDAIERVQGPLGDFGDFVAELCPHLTVVGEGYFVEDADEFDVWSSDEMRRASAGATAQRHPDEAEGDPRFKLRVWRSDPQWRHKADSPLRSVQTEADTIILLRNMTQALTRSRLTAKILGIPDELSFASSNPEEEDPDSDPFMNDLIEAIVTSVTDDQSAARFAPLLIRGPGERLGQITEIDLTRDMPEWIGNLTDQSISRLANGLDFPAAMLVGLEDLNHWSAWVVEESTYKQHIDPLVQLILDSLTRGYLWPYLEEARVPNFRDFRFWRDYSDLTARTASVETTLAAKVEGLISDEAARKYLGFNEADAPDEPDEPEEEVVVGLPADRDNVVPGPPLVAAAVPASDLGDIDRRLYTQITEAAQAALDRAMERAGNRIRSEVVGGGGGSGRPAKHPTFAAQIDGHRGRDISLTLGRQVVTETLQLSDDDLVPDGTFNALGERVEAILRRGQEQTHAAAQRLLGTELARNEDAERGWRERARDFLIAALSALALRRLFTPDAKPNPADTGEINDTAVPAGDVFDTLTIAGGGEPAVDPTQPRGLATGQQTEDWIQETGAIREGYVWQHGAPAVPFEPHLNLNGTRFERWTSEVLATPASASWLSTPYMFPGDHRGCQCLAVPIVEVPDELA